MTVGQELYSHYTDELDAFAAVDGTPSVSVWAGAVAVNTRRHIIRKNDDSSFVDLRMTAPRRTLESITMPDEHDGYK